MLKIDSKFKPAGDQPRAIKNLVLGHKKGYRYQTLLGVTGSGKTYTMASVISKLKIPTLIISHNKTLAAQLYEEFKNFFPNNSVHYFVSYYDYYQPESYLPQTDTYIAKDAKINEEIDHLRHQAVQSLFSKEQTIIVASVSCIYNLGSPKIYKKLSLKLKIGQSLSRYQLLKNLSSLQYERNDYEFAPGRFRIRVNLVDVFMPTGNYIARLEIKNGKLKSIIKTSIFLDSEKKIKEIEVFPAKFWLSSRERLDVAISNIKLELGEQIKKLKKQKKIIEAYRLEKRTKYDISLLKEIGWCKGIENYSSHLEFRKNGESPFTLLDYFRHSFKNNFLVFIDESHMTIPQIRGMYAGEKARKETLINYGFRLPSAMNNRPLKFDEFLKRIPQTIFVSATPGEFERRSSSQIVQQLIRPTYLLDPSIEIKKTKNQLKIIIEEIKKRIKKKQKILLITLTKKLAEALSSYLKGHKIKSTYLHSEIKTLTRPRILNDLRKGKYDVLIGVNLLREGLDLPEVSLIIILDADKEGFLRDETSLIQIIGRASRHPEGHVIMFADKMTKSMKMAIEETKRRRSIQLEYNKKNNLKPQQTERSIKDTLPEQKKDRNLPADEFLSGYLKELEMKLSLAQRNLQFEKAALLEKEIKKVKMKIKRN